MHVYSRMQARQTLIRYFILFLKSGQIADLAPESPDSAAEQDQPVADARELVLVDGTRYLGISAKSVALAQRLKMPIVDFYEVSADAIAASLPLYPDLATEPWLESWIRAVFVAPLTNGFGGILPAKTVAAINVIASALYQRVRCAEKNTSKLHTKKYRELLRIAPRSLVLAVTERRSAFAAAFLNYQKLAVDRAAWDAMPLSERSGHVRSCFSADLLMGIPSANRSQLTRAGGQALKEYTAELIELRLLRPSLASCVVLSPEERAAHAEILRTKYMAPDEDVLSELAAEEAVKEAKKAARAAATADSAAKTSPEDKKGKKRTRRAPEAGAPAPELIVIDEEPRVQTPPVERPKKRKRQVVTPVAAEDIPDEDDDAADLLATLAPPKQSPMAVADGVSEQGEEVAAAAVTEPTAVAAVAPVADPTLAYEPLRAAFCTFQHPRPGLSAEIDEALATPLRVGAIKLVSMHEDLSGSMIFTVRFALQVPAQLAYSSPVFTLAPSCADPTVAQLCVYTQTGHTGQPTIIHVPMPDLSATEFRYPFCPLGFVAPSIENDHVADPMHWTATYYMTIPVEVVEPGQADLDETCRRGQWSSALPIPTELFMCDPFRAIQTQVDLDCNTAV